jgi:pyruvate dehydrogenase E1 component alpha subunit
MLTYRYRGHSMSDPAKYRTKDEVQKMRDRARSHRAGQARLLDKKWAAKTTSRRSTRMRATCHRLLTSPRTIRSRIVSELYTDIRFKGRD